MRLLILGGTAFLSRRLAQMAIVRAHDVVCLARGTTGEPPPGTDFLVADRGAGPVAYAAAVGEWDAVVDVSREPCHVAEAVAALGGRAGHWTFVSSGSVYAHPDDPPGLTEANTALLPAFSGTAPSTPETYGEAKVACEHTCAAALGDRLHISRAGLIGGRGDTTDRFGYWPGRFARNPGDPVLVPDALTASTQVIAVDDLACWILDAAEQGITGTFNAYGHPVPLGDVLELAARVAGSTSTQVAVDPEWLVEQSVDYWSGPESLPLWLPGDFTAFGARSNAAAVAAGMRLSPLEDLMTECLVYERELGLDRTRHAGLSAEHEQELLASWASTRST